MSQMGCGESFEGVAVAADIFYQRDAKVFIGPYCNSELDAVAKMAAYWNIPVIGYMASSNVFADKNIYKTLARVSLRTTNSLALAVTSLLNHYGWNKVKLKVTFKIIKNLGCYCNKHRKLGVRKNCSL